MGVAVGVIPVVPGFIHAATTEGGVVAEPNFLDQLYRYGVFVAFGARRGLLPPALAGPDE